MEGRLPRDTGFVSGTPMDRRLLGRPSAEDQKWQMVERGFRIACEEERLCDHGQKKLGKFRTALGVSGRNDPRLPEGSALVLTGREVSGRERSNTETCGVLAISYTLGQ